MNEATTTKRRLFLSMPSMPTTPLFRVVPKPDYPPPLPLRWMDCSRHSFIHRGQANRRSYRHTTSTVRLLCMPAFTVGRRLPILPPFVIRPLHHGGRMQGSVSGWMSTPLLARARLLCLCVRTGCLCPFAAHRRDYWMPVHSPTLRPMPTVPPTTTPLLHCSHDSTTHPALPHPTPLPPHSTAPHGCGRTADSIWCWRRFGCTPLHFTAAHYPMRGNTHACPVSATLSPFAFASCCQVPHR